MRGYIIKIDHFLKKNNGTKLPDLYIEFYSYSKMNKIQSSPELRTHLKDLQIQINLKEKEKIKLNINKLKFNHYISGNRASKSLTRRLRNQYAKNRVEKLVVDQIVYTSPSEIGQKFNQLYQDLYNLSLSPELKDIKSFLLNTQIPRISPQDLTNLNKKISPEEVQFQIDRLATNKTPVPDDFTNLYYKYMKSYLLKPLTEMFNQAAENEVRSILRKSPFLVPDDSVSIMDGTDEGILAWIAVNFLTGSTGFSACYSEVLPVVKGKVHRVAEILNTQFYAFSYFYDRAAECDLIDYMEGGTVKVRDFARKAEEVCENMARFSSLSPFLCMDLTYISALLQEGLGFEDQTPVLLRKKMHHVEISWTLGAILQVLRPMHY
ncbi:Ectonucleoside triphosphate diphosphohydrolase 5 [Pelobates cultripes]|uniref:nucleoside diphosphate phosphatase n=1 Tax=Pelobates cultripes TaxID=61616 RepID=A0AAD1TNV0_PELCU|nr:Ectonucleoside triphosphate diphosphohydrolase 5 [Pelobates cultripes]